MEAAGDRGVSGDTVTEREEGIGRVGGGAADYDVWYRASWSNCSLGGVWERGGERESETERGGGGGGGGREEGERDRQTDRERERERERERGRGREVGSEREDRERQRAYIDGRRAYKREAAVYTCDSTPTSSGLTPRVSPRFWTLFCSWLI